MSNDVQITFIGLFQSHYKTYYVKSIIKIIIISQNNCFKSNFKQKHYSPAICDKCVPKCPTEYASTYVTVSASIIGDNAVTSSIRSTQVFPELVGKKTRAVWKL